MTPSLKSVQCISPVGLHRMVYKEWGDPANPDVLVCVHGLTRVSDDFDALAPALASRYRVICPDVAGRGRSDWLADPRLYVIPQYASDMVTLLARADARSVQWLGTSMGGLIGLALASLPHNPIDKLILNDIGPAIDPQALTRIGKYVGEQVKFADFAAAAAYIRAISVSFGEHSDAQWHKLAADVLRQDEDGRWIRHYDPGLAAPFLAASADQAQASEAALWAAYDAIACPTLLIRGADSDLLSRATAEAMAARGPRPDLLEWPHVGHAPTLVQPEQIAAIRDWLLCTPVGVAGVG
ncbi:MAG: alpha/beta hydrolase [Herbaspirillum sp.]|jgi:pimeloyl-ACP methyl ester carboxylesterase|nr:alpha/beta hydrolase [Herbaspirillum sp.]